ncbi:hypothetical protein T484DRAFT_1904440 [Baffinella frigidus]|nr:hypothetical protein T484DRAFT_1904440 [Cryptophyta sp. CCMP2293]
MLVSRAEYRVLSTGPEYLYDSSVIVCAPFARRKSEGPMVGRGQAYRLSALSLCFPMLALQATHLTRCLSPRFSRRCSRPTARTSTPSRLTTSASAPTSPSASTRARPPTSSISSTRRPLFAAWRLLHGGTLARWVLRAGPIHSLPGGECIAAMFVSVQVSV